VTPADVVAAIDYLIASRVVTGEVLTIDGGQRFDPRVATCSSWSHDGSAKA
jgi:NAD(P)-dependent dehydrogenase (short-subunit alcohol dehydrogenase family)